MGMSTLVGGQRLLASRNGACARSPRTRDAAGRRLLGRGTTCHAGCDKPGASGRVELFHHLGRGPRAAAAAGTAAPVVPADRPPMLAGPELEAFLDSLKYDTNGLVVAIAQDVDTGAILMQAFADRTAVKATLTSCKATFYSRSRRAQWMKGESSGNVIHVTAVHVDCDRDSLVYLGAPVGPTCHTGAETCYFTRVAGGGDAPAEASGAALSSLYDLEATVMARRADLNNGVGMPAAKPSWTQKLLSDPVLLCKKVREEAGELCQTLEQGEGPARAASEAADVLYHAAVLLNLQEVPLSAVMAELRRRFGTSGIAEKNARPPKPSS